MLPEISFLQYLEVPFNTIKLSILKKFGAGTLVPFYGTEVPAPCGKKWLSLMTLEVPFIWPVFLVCCDLVLKKIIRKTKN